MLDVQVAEAFADAALRLIQSARLTPGDVRSIGSHGQTIRHRPAAAHPFTWQVGDANVIAERTGIDTVADFRRRDLAAGGQGAPLVPAFHAALLHDANEARAVLNLGGIANFTLLPVQGDVRGFDTGPANALMDAWCEQHHGTPFDAHGAFAAQRPHRRALLERLLAEPWFTLPPPKSSGREHFHLDWVRTQVRGGEAPKTCRPRCSNSPRAPSPMRFARTSRTRAACSRAAAACTTRCLLARIAAHLPGVRVESTAVHGLDPDFVEAMAFAWLARETLAGRPGNVPAVTGARGPRVLGVVYPR